jgi:hypothetical protein
MKARLPANRGEATHYFEEFFSRDLADKEKGYIGLKDIGKRVWHNINYYRLIATHLILSYPLTFTQGTRLIPALLALGFTWSWFKQRTVIEYYILLYVLVCLLWRIVPGVRFYIPIIPFLFYYLFFGIDIITKSTVRWLKLSDKLKKTVRVGIPAMVVVLLSGAHIKTGLEFIGYLQKRSYYHRSIKNFLSSIQWTAQNTRPDNIIVSDRAPWVYLLSERKTYGFSRVQDTSEVLNSIIQRNPNYIISSRVTVVGRYLSRMLTDYSHLFTEVYREGDSAVYRVNEKDE